MAHSIFPTEAPPESLLWRARAELCVVIEEEYGYMHWLWFPRLSQDDLIEFWLNLEDLPLYPGDPGSALAACGDWFAMTTQAGTLADEPDDYHPPPDIERREEALWRVWQQLRNAPVRCFAHLWRNHDSWLWTPRGIWFHGGYHLMGREWMCPIDRRP